MALIGGVCDRTPEVRDVLVAHASANDPMVTHCSQVGIDELASSTSRERWLCPARASRR